MLRNDQRLTPEDEFDVQVQHDDSIVLQRTSGAPNKGLSKLLSACPHPFELPKRDCDDVSPIQL